MSREGPNRGFRAVVDRDECFGFAYCVETAPLLFALDGDGISMPREVDGELALLVAAVEGCPRSAISILRARDEHLDHAGR